MREHKDFIIDRLIKNKMTLSVAESATGGMIAANLVAVPNASQGFKGSVVAYSKEAKMNILGVKQQSIEQHGLISGQIAREMAIGSIKAFNTDVSVSITGIAGPDAVEGKPVGLYYFCIIIVDRAYDYEGRINPSEVMQMIEDITGETVQNLDEVSDPSLVRTCYRRLMTSRIIEEVSKLLIKHTTQSRL